MVVFVQIVATLGGAVLSELHGTGVVSDQTELTAVPSILAESKWHAYSCQSGHIWLGSTSPCSSQRSWR